MTQELEAAPPSGRDALMTTELVPEQILPKVLGTFGLTATYVFIICWITGSSVMAAGGWTAIPMWVLGIVTFLVPAALAVLELGNLWPGQGGVYIWAFRTMGDKMAFLGGYLSWVPVVLNTASSPAIVLQFLLLAFHAELGLTMSIILQLVILWAVVALALAKLAANQRIMNVTFVIYCVLTLTIFVCGVIYAAGHGAATPFSAHDALIPNFAGAGFLYGTVLLYLVGVETPFNMGAEFLSVKRSAAKMIGWGSLALILIYLLSTLGTMLVLPGDQINAVTGVIGNLGVSGFPGLMEVAAVVMAVIFFVAMTTYQVAYSRLIFVSGLERHLPRIFTHLNPRTRNPVTAILIQGVLSSLLVVGLYSQSSMANVTIYLQGGLSVVWLLSGFFFFIPLL
ncbi:MAG: glutamate:GABA antiporter, partial [Mycobacterium sp.]|nr:glutamate:GABA antiporter [Mycobacterium sp.]